MVYAIVILTAYLLGSSSMAYYLAKLNHADLQKNGSGNLGASNATVLLGWWAGVIVALHDIGKAALAVFLAQLIFPDTPCIGAVAGVACILGHIFPFYLKFRGGKGLAAFIGMSLVLDWKVALAAIVLLVLITLITDYIALGTLTTSVVVPVGVGVLQQSVAVPMILLVATVVMFCKHRDNLVRIRNGSEIGLRSTAKGENRINK